MPGPLQGIRVIEACRFISGPFAGMLLADLGADVIKVEQPGEGDPFRAWQTARRPYSPQFVAYNRNKRGLTLDLGTSAGREVFLALARDVDVVLENFRPGTMDRMGIGYERLRALNPRLIYCAISGFGTSGPYVHRPSYDTVASGLSSLYSELWDRENPVATGPAFSDGMAGMYAAQGILAALVGRSITGRGQRVDATMLGSMLGFLTSSVTSYLDAGIVSDPYTRPRQAQVYAFVAQDGLPFAVHLSSPPKFWQGLCQAVGHPELVEDARFKTKALRVKNYVELDTIFKEAVRQKPRAEWFRVLEGLDVPHTPLYTVAEVFQDPQVQHMGLEERIPIPGYDEPLRTGGYPLRLSDTPCETVLPPPLLGEHTAAILQQLGYTDDQIDQLRADRVV